ncbi:MAG TPA: hypothetical protein VHE35_09845 [Kofleriaceae bacterium]|nr:hypothetical protein [Kofleriaceae bacterium]
MRTLKMRLLLALAVMTASLAGAAPKAFALHAPSSGTWELSLHHSTFGNDGGVYRVIYASSGSSMTHQLSGTTLDANASSWILCNNTGSTHTFTINIYSDYNESTLIDTRTMSILNGACFIHNIASSSGRSLVASY